MHVEQEKDFRDQDIPDLLSKTVKKSHFLDHRYFNGQNHTDRVFNTTFMVKINADKLIGSLVRL